MKKGLTIPEVIQVVFLILKLCKIIKWSWLWVLSPTWITLAIILFAVIVTKIKIWKDGY